MATATLLPRDKRAYHEYMDDMNNSQGFYVTPSQDGSAMVGAVRPVEESYEHYYRKAKIAAKFAVEEHNNKGGESLKFIKIVRVNGQPSAGVIYYITMAVADSSDEIGLYEAKVWEKRNTGFSLQLFRPAPYWIQSSDKLSNNLCCIAIDNLLPNMDECYLYYKCFYWNRKEIVGIEINRNEEENRAVLWFKSREALDEFVNKCQGRTMPLTNMSYQF